MSNFTGLYRALLYDLSDPERRGRARLYVPAVLGTSATAWATPMDPGVDVKAGDAAWVWFENGDLSRPVWSSGPAAARTVENASAALDTRLDVVESAIPPLDTRLDVIENPLKTLSLNGAGVYEQRNVISFEENAPNLPGYLLLQTKIPYGNHMIRLHIRGWEYASYRNVMDLTITFYAFQADGGVYSFDAVNNGSKPVPVQVLRRDSDNTVAITINSPVNWEYPKFSVDVRVGHTAPTTAMMTGWTWTRTSTLAGYTSKLNRDPVAPRGTPISRQYGHVGQRTTMDNDNVTRLVHYYSPGVAIPPGARTAKVHARCSAIANINAQCHWQAWVRIVGGPDAQVATSTMHNNGYGYTDIGFAWEAEVDVSTFPGTTLEWFHYGTNDAGSGAPVQVTNAAYQITFLA